MKSFDHKSGQYIKIDDAEIYYEEIGKPDGHVILMLHGGLGNIAHFNNILPYIPDKFRVIGIDSRGHGKSTLGSKELTYALLQEDIEYILNILGINRLSIIGFSNGGTISYRIASCATFKIDHLVTIGAPWNNKHLEHILPSFSKLNVEEWIKQSPNDYKEYQELNPERDINRIFKFCINLALDKNSSRPGDIVKNINCPILAIRGDKDFVVSQDNIEELSRLGKNTSILNIRDAGHEAIIDQPEMVARAILNLIN